MDSWVRIFLPWQKDRDKVECPFPRILFFIMTTNKETNHEGLVKKHKNALKCSMLIISLIILMILIYLIISRFIFVCKPLTLILILLIGFSGLLGLLGCSYLIMYTFLSNYIRSNGGQFFVIGIAWSMILFLMNLLVDIILK